MAGRRIYLRRGYDPGRVDEMLLRNGWRNAPWGTDTGRGQEYVEVSPRRDLNRTDLACYIDVVDLFLTFGVFSEHGERARR